MASLSDWSFTPLVPAFPPTVFPNFQIWNASNGMNLEYQIEISWPLEWESQGVETSALAMYVLDGNALAMTAVEGFKRRLPIEPTQPDSVVIGIGYPLTDSVYSPQRFIDFRPPLPEGSEPDPEDQPSGADDFVAFLDEALRPFIKSTVFPNVEFTRDALYGHSFGGLLVIHALLTGPDLFDVFISASPAIMWNDGSILDEFDTFRNSSDPTCCGTKTKPALAISYGSLEDVPIRRRAESEEQFESRRALIETYNMRENCNRLYERTRGSPFLRDVVLKEYEGQDHTSVGASAMLDGIEYFVDW